MNERLGRKSPLGHPLIMTQEEFVATIKLVVFDSAIRLTTR